MRRAAVALLLAAALAGCAEDDDAPPPPHEQIAAEIERGPGARLSADPRLGLVWVQEVRCPPGDPGDVTCRARVTDDHGNEARVPVDVQVFGDLFQWAPGAGAERALAPLRRAEARADRPRPDHPDLRNRGGRMIYAPALEDLLYEHEVEGLDGVSAFVRAGTLLIVPISPPERVDRAAFTPRLCDRLARRYRVRRVQVGVEDLNREQPPRITTVCR